MVKIRYIIMSDCVELGGLVVRLRSVRHVAQEVIADPLSAKGPVQSHDKAGGVLLLLLFFGLPVGNAPDVPQPFGLLYYP
jgi:hypothetical protein